jgi:Avidin family
MSIAGTWINSYGSEMILTQDPSSGWLAGTYQSTTGSSGQYNVLGYALNPAPTTGLGEAFAISIFWHSTEGGTGDPSWHWVSGLGGQAVLGPGTSSVTLNLIHCMVATSNFPGLAAPGSYLDKLVYQSTPIAATAKVPSVLTRPALRRALAAVSNPINGSWTCQQDSTIVLTVSLTDQQFGMVSGTLSYGGTTYAVNGFTDTYMDGSTSLQSLAVVARLDALNMVISLAGSLDNGTGLITLTKLLNSGTANDATYVQTTVDKLIFARK